jgi:ATP-dependent helicase/nuclease subunit A
MREAPDQAQRDAALCAREHTVLIDAGAGAGKTSILVGRIVRLVAPDDDNASAIPLSRIAAVTFTRRAAGELRLRIRGKILEDLAKPSCSPIRTKRLLDALGTIDVAFIGTIHSFADRLLRLQPMKARLSPAYLIAEDTDALVDETFALLMHSVDSGTLAAELPNEESAYVVEVERTFQEALRAGVLVRSFERDPAPPKVGLDLLVRGFIEHRDRELIAACNEPFDRTAFERVAHEFLAAMRGITGDTRGARWLVTTASILAELLDDPDDMALYALVPRIERGTKLLRKTKDFVKGSLAQLAWNAFTGDNGFGTRLSDPLVAAMARKLAHTRHVVARLYEKVKSKREAVDSIDLLLVLRNLVRDDLDARAFYQQMFDHILVDELQDTDPLQAEVILFLSESKPCAFRWQDVAVGPGRLTLVGDPKQSIYRFRRADVGMYDRMRAQVQRADHVNVTLTANFRSVPHLITWANRSFAAILGTDDARQFDPETGQVFHREQLPCEPPSGPPPVHHLPYAFADGEERKVAATRALEGEAVASYLRWLVERSGLTVRDEGNDKRRSIRWSDIAVLALVTTNVRCVSEAFDRNHIPHAISGGTLFTSDPLHRRFVLGLRALADRNDGVAEAALLRPPFFAIDLLDLVRHDIGAGDDAARRGAAARAWVRETRRKRFERTPGQTARALLEETGIGRGAALGPNGEQRLRHLREICLQLELDAAAAGLDFDGVTAQMREWIEHPIQLDPPRPVGGEAVQVLTVHQAKGLEFPVVVLWDGMGQWRPYEAPTPWRIDRDGSGWAMKTNDVEWEEPPNSGRIDRERRYAEAERRRLVYVAATRARDLLVIPKPAWTQLPDTYVHAQLLNDADPLLVHVADPFVEGQGAPWSASPAAIKPITEAVDIELLSHWSAACDEAKRSRHAPRSVTGIAKAAPVIRVGDTEIETEHPRPRRPSRFGSVFGDVVHQAIGSVLSRGWPASRAVESAATIAGLADHCDEAVADVERAITTLRDAELIGDKITVRLEYPIAVVRDGAIVSGYLDFISAIGDTTIVVDFKTDQVVGTDVLATYAHYVRQVQTYADVVGATRSALLFTANGQLAWLPDRS